MNIQIKKIILLLVIFINVTAVTAAAQKISDQAAARRIYEQSLSNMDKINARYNMKMQFNSVIGKINITDIMNYQSSPFLMKSDIKSSFSLLGKAEQPLFSMMQYSEINNNAIYTYSAVQNKDGKYDNWMMHKTKVPQELTNYLEDIAAPNETQYLKIKKIMDAVKEVSVISDDENTVQLKIIFSSNKLFSYANMIAARNLMQDIPEEEKDFVWNMMTTVQPELQNSGDIEAHAVIDKTSKSIISTDFNITPQLKALTKIVMDILLKTDKTKAAKALVSNDNDMTMLTDSLQGHISITVKPINDVMELAIPQHVRQTAVIVKTPVNKDMILKK